MKGWNKIEKILGYNPNKWQKEVRADKSRFKVICAGRRSGKSFYVAHDTKDGVMADLFKANQKVLIVAPTYRHTQRVWNTVLNAVYRIQKWGRENNDELLKNIIHRVHDSKGDFSIETIFGTTVEAWSADDPEKLVGMGNTKVIIDEAGLVKDKAWSQSLRPTLADFKGGAIFISTPKGENWFYDIWMKGQDELDTEWRSWKYTTYDNEHIDKNEIDSMAKDMSDVEYSQEIMAEFIHGMGKMFGNASRCIRGALRKPDKNKTYLMGVDLGRKVSFTVIVIIDPEDRQVVFFDRFHGIHWRQQIEKIKKAYFDYNSPLGCIDATGSGGDMYYEQLLENGVGLEPYIFSGGWGKSKRQLMDKLAVLIERKQIFFPNVRQLLNELAAYKVEQSEAGNIKYGTFGKFTDDCVDALALACWNLPVEIRSSEAELISPPITDY